LTSQVPEKVQKERPSTLDEPLNFMFGVSTNSVVIVPPFGMGAETDHFPTSENAVKSLACAPTHQAQRKNPEKTVAATICIACLYQQAHVMTSAATYSAEDNTMPRNGTLNQ